MDGEGEAIFAAPLSKRSPRRENFNAEPDAKRPKRENERKPQEEDKEAKSTGATLKRPRSSSFDKSKEGTPTAPPPPPRPQSVPRPPPGEQRRRSLSPGQSRPPPPPGATNAPAAPQLKHPPAPPTSSQAKPLPPANRSTSAPPKAPTHAAVPQPGTAQHRRSLSHDGTAPEAGVIDMQSPNKKPDVKLPSGWMCVWSKSQKRWYFCEFCWILRFLYKKSALSV